MELIYGGPNFNKSGKNFVALGTFDGVHVGHQELIREMVSGARETGGKSIVVTFSNHPRQLLRPDSPIKLLTSPSIRAQLIRGLGVDAIVFLEFTREMAAMEPLPFVRDILVERFNTSQVYVGYNYSFGKKGNGSPGLLEELGRRFGFAVTIMPPVCLEGIPVSSTVIRKQMAAGEVERACKFLGHLPVFQGEVIHGNGFGRSMGYPTANLLIDAEMQLPFPGVYFGQVEVEKVIYDAIANIGTRPTVNGEGMSFEIHLLDFCGNLYGKQLTFYLKKRLRDEKKFFNLQELTKQIARDVASVSCLRDK